MARGGRESTPLHPHSENIFKINGYRIYVDNMTGEKFRLLTWISFIGQFVHPVGGGGDMVKGVDRKLFIYFSYMIIWCKILEIINPF